MLNESAIAHLIGRAYDAGDEPALWQSFFEELAEALRSLPSLRAPERRQELLDPLMAHVRRSVRMQARIAASAANADAAESIIQQLGCGMILADQTARVLLIDAQARKICDQRNAVALDGERIVATRARDTERLHRLIASPPPYGQLITIARTGNLRPLPLSIIPIRHGDGTALNGGAAAIFMIDLSPRTLPEPAALRQQYGLTTAEAALTTMLMDGKTIKEIASTKKVSVATARTHLKRILLKTKTHSQRELVFKLMDPGIPVESLEPLRC